MSQTQLGKIVRAEFGWGGYQEAMLGLSLSFETKGGTVSMHRGAWGTERSEFTQWSEESRLAELGIAVMFLGKILRDAKSESVSGLVGAPVECTFEGNTLKDWRILTEVL